MGLGIEVTIPVGISVLGVPVGTCVVLEAVLLLRIMVDRVEFDIGLAVLVAEVVLVMVVVEFMLGNGAPEGLKRGGTVVEIPGTKEDVDELATAVVELSLALDVGGPTIPPVESRNDVTVWLDADW